MIAVRRVSHKRPVDSHRKASKNRKRLRLSENGHGEERPVGHTHSGKPCGRLVL
ncbi:hypothetical protein SUS17_629 [Sphingomonas sp. S17]|nr:hypothetical protein SUS17_629 [Sphingomonas sp. S17]